MPSELRSKRPSPNKLGSKHSSPNELRPKCLKPIELRSKCLSYIELCKKVLCQLMRQCQNLRRQVRIWCWNGFAKSFSSRSFYAQHSLNSFLNHWLRGSKVFLPISCIIWFTPRNFRIVLIEFNVIRLGQSWN